MLSQAISLREGPLCQQIGIPKSPKNILADHLGIGPLRARATLKGTLQNGCRSAILPLARRYKVDRNFQVRRLAEKWATDTIYEPVKSLSQCMYM